MLLPIPWPLLTLAAILTAQTSTLVMGRLPATLLSPLLIRSNPLPFLLIWSNLLPLQVSK